jgi:glucokinase-like ROK family protein
MNRMAVLNIIKQHEPLSRQQLAKLTGLTPPAITGIVREFLEMGFVQEVGLGKSHGGRRPVKLKLNSGAGYVIGVEVTSHEVTLALADLKNQPTNIRKLDIDMTEPEQGMDSLVTAIGQIIDEQDQETEKKNFFAVGMAFPGILNVKEGLVKRSVNLGPLWRQFPLRERLEQELGLPVFLENNSKAATLAERWFGGGKENRDLVYINLGEGISAGVIINDVLIKGHKDHAGEIGHIVIAEDGPLCNCGNRGCLEAICGIPALMRKIYAELPLLTDDDPLKELWQNQGHLGIDDVLSFARQENSYSWQLLQQVGRHIGLVLSNVINMLNPEVVFIGGRLGSVADIFIDGVRDIVDSHTFPEIARTTEIKVSTLGANSGVIGACALALKELLDSDSDMLEGMQANNLNEE